jgi:hypothetical protein
LRNTPGNLDWLNQHERALQPGCPSGIVPMLVSQSPRRHAL